MVRRIELSRITPKQIKQSIKFSEQCVITNIEHYKKRNQFDRDKIEQDICFGKYMEFRFYNWLINNNIKCSPPDLKIYPPSKKSFDADLITNTNKPKLHIKSCLGARDIPNSWVFQPEDELVLKPTSTEVLGLGVLNGDASYGYLIDATDVIGSYKEPRKLELKGFKKVLYEDDIIEMMK